MPLRGDRAPGPMGNQVRTGSGSVALSLGGSRPGTELRTYLGRVLPSGRGVPRTLRRGACRVLTQGSPGQLAGSRGGGALQAGPDTGAQLSPCKLEEGPCSPFPVPTQEVTWCPQVLNEQTPSLPGVFAGSWVLGVDWEWGAGGGVQHPLLGQLEEPHTHTHPKPQPATPLPHTSCIPDSTLNGFDQPAHR